jgi:hypothetical protein
MNESFLHFIWQHQYYAIAGLTTTDGHSVIVRFPGVYNQNAGPDFLHARIQLDKIEWNGAIEIHIKALDYLAHGHQHDPAYDQVILHVVWKNNGAVRRTDGTIIPAVELSERVNKDLLNRYQILSQSLSRIPCQPARRFIPEDYHVQMMEQAGTLRLEEKSQRVLTLHEECNNNWNETAYRLLASNFGMKVNAHLFLRVAAALPLRILQRYANDLTDLESMLFGVSGLLEGLVSGDNYVQELIDRFRHLRRKFEFNPAVNSWEWKYHRMRPGNFPTLRLAQLAALLQQSDGIFTRLIQVSSTDEIQDWLKVQPSSYWLNHYDFDKAVSSGKCGGLGKEFIDHILINVSAPLAAAYAKWSQDELLLRGAVGLLKKLPAESNKMIRVWLDAGFAPQDAYQSQALIYQLQNNCHQRRCLQCLIGTKILSR